MTCARLRSTGVIALTITTSTLFVTTRGFAFSISSSSVNNLRGKDWSRGEKCHPYIIADRSTQTPLHGRVFAPRSLAERASEPSDGNDEHSGDPGRSSNFDSASNFTQGSPNQRRRHEDGAAVDSDMRTLRDRLLPLQIEALEAQAGRPPSPDLDPVGFVSAVLAALREPDDPLPDSGFRVLLRSSTKGWRRLVCGSVGAPPSAGEDEIARRLGDSIGRPRNLFGILVDDGAEMYELSFPNDIVDFEDGTCWLESHLRDPESERLLVAMRWRLERRDLDGAWLIDFIDWQDYRDSLGTGQENQMRFCNL